MLEYADPDIIIASETWLKPEIKESVVSTSTGSMLDLAIMAVPPWALPGRSFLATKW
jgi:hypothetical protein